MFEHLHMKAMAPHSSTLAWKIPWTEEPGRLQSKGSLESDTTERLHFHFSLSWIGEGNGNPLQCSCLENPRDGGAWWAAIYGVAQSWTRLKWLSVHMSECCKCVYLCELLMEEYISVSECVSVCLEACPPASECVSTSSFVFTCTYEEMCVYMWHIWIVSCVSDIATMSL